MRPSLRSDWVGSQIGKPTQLPQRIPTRTLAQHDNLDSDPLKQLSPAHRERAIGNASTPGRIASCKLIIWNTLQSKCNRMKILEINPDRKVLLILWNQRISCKV